jgi:hypothetical protein
MSLIVSTVWRDPATGDSQSYTDWENGNYMAGVERARFELWGSDALRRRGAKFLPQLAESDLWVAPEELDAFVSEIDRLLSDIEALRAELRRSSDCFLSHYLNNILRAADYAHEMKGGVSIT